MIFKGGFSLVGFALYLQAVVDTGPIPVAALLGLVFLAMNITGILPLERVVAAEIPHTDAAAALFGGIGGWLVVIAGLLATASTANAVILSSTRYPFAMARDGLMPHAFNRIHPRFGTPLRAVLLTGLIMVGMALLLDVERLAKLGGAFGIMVFSTVNGALIVLRRRAPDWYRPNFRAPLSPWLPLLGILGALALLTQVGMEALVSAVGLVLFAIGWYFWRVRREGGALPID